MKEDKFKIVKLIKELIINIDKNLVNFPKKDIEYKKEIRKCSYDLLLLAQEGNITLTRLMRTSMCAMLIVVT